MKHFAPPVGTIPPCFATDFPNLITLQLHDTNLHGGLPQHWNAKNKLNSLSASNNRRMDGQLQ